MDLNPELIEGRNHGVLPLVGGVDQTSSKFLAAPGTLRDCLNYEVESTGYTRSAGLMLFNGTFDDDVKNAFVCMADSGVTVTGAGIAPQPGQRVTWGTTQQHSGTCVYYTTGPDPILWLANIDGDVPVDGDVLKWYDELGIFESILSLSGADLGELLDIAPGGSFYVTSPDDYVTKIKTANAWLTAAAASGPVYWQPSPPGTGPITGGFQFDDDVYVCRDFWGVGFKSGQSDNVVDDTFLGRTITSGAFTGKIAKVEVTKGSWANNDAEGTIYCEPVDDASVTMDVAVFDALATNDVITFSQDGQLLDTTTAEVLTSNHANKGWLWKSHWRGWYLVDPGYHARFRAGTNAPNATVGPLFLQQRNASSALSSSVMPNGTPTQEANGGRQAWTSPTNIQTDDGSVATASLAAYGTSGLLVVEVSDTDAIPHGDVEITGIEVEVEVWDGDGSVSYLRNVRIRAAGETYMSDQASDTAIVPAASGSPMTVGGQFDDWGIVGSTKDDFNTSGGAYVTFEVYNDSGGPINVSCDYVKVTVHYVIRGQRLYGEIYRTTSNTYQNIGHVDLFALDVHTGYWADDNVSGYMGFTDLQYGPGPYDTLAFWGGREPVLLYTEATNASASAGGDFICELVGGVHRNLLPSYAELQAEGSQWESMQASFYVNDEGESVYVTTGAGPAFFVDNKDRLAQIFLPIPRAKDKPRHLAYHANSLCLGLNTGHLLVSNPDAPNDFDVTGAASTHSFRDPIYGLQSLSGNALGVFCRESISALVGTSAVAGAPDPYKVQNLVPNSGIVEYSLIDAAIPLYCDYQGINNLATSDRFGDFEAGRMSELVENWMRQRLQRNRGELPQEIGVAGAVPVRSKNQYRVFFNDGYIANMYLGTMQQAPQITFMHYDTDNYTSVYVPTWLDSSVQTDGRERVLIGTEDGKVWMADAGNGVVDTDGHSPLDAWVETNPTNSGNPQGATKTLGMVVMADIHGGLDISTGFSQDYLPFSGTLVTKEIGDSSSTDKRPTSLVARPDYTDVYTDVFTDGVGMKIQTTLDGSLPHTLQTLIHRFSYKGQRRNNTQVSR